MPSLMATSLRWRNSHAPPKPSQSLCRSHEIREIIWPYMGFARNAPHYHFNILQVPLKNALISSPTAPTSVWTIRWRSILVKNWATSYVCQKLWSKHNKNNDTQNTVAKICETISSWRKITIFNKSFRQLLAGGHASLFVKHRQMMVFFIELQKKP
jgi:hypothetical protein